MKLIRAVVILVLCATLLLAGCGNSEADNSEAIDYITKYMDATIALNQSGAFTAYIHTEKQLEIGTETFLEASEQTVRYQGFGSSEQIMDIQESVKVGSQSYDVELVHADGWGYLTLGGQMFSGQCGPESVSVHYTPPILLTPQHYNTIDITLDNGNIYYSFSDADQIEEWTNLKDVAAEQCSGSATVNDSGLLTQNQYQITYMADSARITLSVSVTLDYETPVSITVPNQEHYLQISSITAPQYLELACSYLLDSENISSSSYTEITGQAFGIHRNQNLELNMQGIDDTFEAHIVTNVIQQDISRKTGGTTLCQTEHYADDLYTIEIDNGGTTPVISITPKEMRKYCQETLLGNIISPEYIASASYTESAEYYTLTLNASDTINEIICAGTSQTLYNDSDFIYNISSDITLKNATCYLTVHKATGLPVSSGFTYDLTHKVDGVDYQLTSKIDQSYLLASHITDSILTKQPTTQTAAVTPPLYRITNEEGLRFWVLPTTEYGIPESYQFPNELLQALTESQTVLLDDSNYSTIYASASRAADPSEEQKEIRNAAKEKLQFFGLYCGGTEGANPATWAIMLAQQEVTRNYHLSSSSNMTRYIAQLAAASNRWIITVSPSIQNSTSDAQDLLLQLVLDHYDRIEDYESDLYYALSSGDQARLDALLDTFTDDLSHADVETLRAYRNSAVSQGISILFDEILNGVQPDQPMFAVINLHYLSGGNNLLNRFEEAGFTVERIEYEQKAED